MGPASPAVPDGDKAIQLEQSQGPDQLLLQIAQRPQFRFQGRKKVALQNPPEAGKNLE
jgi:hypothetical protein